MHSEPQTTVALLHAANRAQSVSALADSAAPVLGERFGAPSAFFCWVRGLRVRAIGGTCAMSQFANGGYQDYMARDPLLKADLACGLPVVRASRLVDYRALQRTELFDVCYRQHGVSNILFCRLAPRADGAEQLGFVLMRSTGDRDFSEQDEAALQGYRDILDATWRRLSETQRLAELQDTFEAVLAGADPRPRLVYRHGRCVWAGRSAQRALGARLPADLGALGVLPPREVAPVVLEGAGGERIWASVFRSTGPDDLAVVVLDLFDQPSPRARQLAVQAGLTTRETQVLDALALGLGTERIARSMFISTHTVRTHIKRLLAKVGVRSRAELHALFEGGYF